MADSVRIEFTSKTKKIMMITTTDEKVSQVMVLSHADANALLQDLAEVVIASMPTPDPVASVRDIIDRMEDRETLSLASLADADARE